MLAIESFGRDTSYSISCTFNTEETADTVNINIIVLMHTDSNVNIGFNVYLNGTVYGSLPADNYRKGSIVNYITTCTINKGNLDIDLLPKLEIVTDGDYNFAGDEVIKYKAATTQTTSSTLTIKAKELDVDKPYKNNLDRITEHELVPDFIYRLDLSEDLQSNEYSTMLSTPYKKVADLLDRLYAACPALVFQRDVKKITIPIDQNTRYISLIIDDVNALDYRVYSAYSDKARLDYSSIFTIKSTNTVFNVTAEFDTEYPCDDYISLLLKRGY